MPRSGSNDSGGIDPTGSRPEHSETERDALGDLFPRTFEGVRVVLICKNAGVSRVVELQEGTEFTIGRLPESSFCIDSPRVSRRHAVVRWTREGISVEDLATPNGTHLRGESVRGERRSVFGGDVLVVGPAEILIAVSANNPRSSAERGGELEVPAGVVVADAAMTKVFRMARRLAATLTTVLIVGETGVGKEVVAETLHATSPRASGPLVRLNCASLPETMLESELFGHERGAFTGADRKKAGYFEAASGGTLLLDEIGEVPIGLQAKLLRVLESRRMARLGSTQEIEVDARIVCATHRDLAAEVAAGRFRQDLFYRISTFTLTVPPLRERPNELLLLAERFAAKFAEAMGEKPLVFAPAAIEALKAHRWPGNVRELKNAIEHGVVLAEHGVLDVEHLPEGVLGKGEEAASGPMRSRVADVERKSIEEALAAESGSRTRAARRLGISRRALLYKLAKYGIGSPPSKRS